MNKAGQRDGAHPNTLPLRTPAANPLLPLPSSWPQVPFIANASKKAGLNNIMCMLSNCREEIFDCVNDEECKKALDCLEECGVNDQVSRGGSVTAR